MKKILIVCLIILGCKKETEERVWIQVRDRITGSPVKQAAVHIFKCVDMDPFCGLISWQNQETGDDGRCSFTKADFDRVTFMRAYRSDYWATEMKKGSMMGSTIGIGIYPCGWMRLRIIRGTTCPPGSYLDFSVSSIQDPDYYSYTRYNAAADSSILIKCYGGQPNRFNWILRDPANSELKRGVWDQQVPRLDSTTTTLNY